MQTIFTDVPWFVLDTLVSRARAAELIEKKKLIWVAYDGMATLLEDLSWIINRTYRNNRLISTYWSHV